MLWFCVGAARSSNERASDSLPRLIRKVMDSGIEWYRNGRKIRAAPPMKNTGFQLSRGRIHSAISVAMIAPTEYMLSMIVVSVWRLALGASSFIKDTMFATTPPRKIPIIRRRSPKASGVVASPVPDRCQRMALSPRCQLVHQRHDVCNDAAQEDPDHQAQESEGQWGSGQPRSRSLSAYGA